MEHAKEHEGEPLYQCGNVSRLQTSKTERNRGHRFYACGRINVSKYSIMYVD